MSCRLLNGARLSALVCFTMGLAGCGMPSSDHKQVRLTPPPATPLGIYDAMAMGLRAGMEERIAMIGQPGEQSAPWSIIDNGIAAIETRRHIGDPGTLKAGHQRRAAWAIAGDVREAWVRAAAAQAMDAEIDGVLARVNSAQDQTLTAAISELKVLKGRMDSGRDDLAVLLRLTGSKGLSLKVDPILLADNGQVPKIPASIENLELLSLTSRTELGTDSSGSLGDLRSLRKKTLDSFPGIRDTLNRKDFGDEKQWNAFAENFTNGLVRIHTLPVTLKDESSRKFLQTMQQQAMTAAILTQVHLAYADYQAKQGAYVTARAEDVTVAPGVTGEVQAMAAKAKSWLALADLKQSETVLMGLLGADVLPVRSEGLSEARLAMVLEQRMERDYAVALNQWNVYAANQDIAPESGVPAIPGLQRVSYESSFPVEIPLAQKLSTRTDVGDQGVSRIDPRSFLPVSRWQVKSLLDAPITEP